MKRIIFASLAVGVLALGAPAATAAPGDAYVGGCSFNASTDPTEQIGGQDTYTGQVNGRTVTFNLASGPVFATLSCEIRVNAVTQASLTTADVATMSGNGAQFGAKVIQFPAGDTDVVELCTIVDFGGGDRRESCAVATTVVIPPDEVNQLIIEFVDPVACIPLAAAGNTMPDVVGTFEIESDGDVLILDAPYWDCAPYDEFPPS